MVVIFFIIVKCEMLGRQYDFSTCESCFQISSPELYGWEEILLSRSGRCFFTVRQD